MKKVVSSILSLVVLSLVANVVLADGVKKGWELELQQLSLNLTSTEVHNSEVYQQTGSANARLTADSQTFIQGKLDFYANYFANKLFWSNMLKMEYGRTNVRPNGKDETITENADKILLTTDLAYRLWNVKDFLGGFEVGPFANIGYETEFDKPENREDLGLKKILRGKVGAKLFEGKYLKQLYAAYIAEADYTPIPGPEVTKSGCEVGFRAEADIRDGIKFICWSYYRNYLSESRDILQNLEYEVEAEARLDVKLWNNISIAPFVNYYSAKMKHYSTVGENWYTGISLSYSTFFKKAKEI